MPVFGKVQNLTIIIYIIDFRWLKNCKLVNLIAKIHLSQCYALVHNLTIIIFVNDFRWLRFIDTFSLLLNAWRGWGGRNCCMKCVQSISITIIILSLLVAAVAICTTASAAFCAPLHCFLSYLCCMDKYTMRLRTVRMIHTQVNNLLMLLSRGSH
jgi:hypothetical protein